MPPVADPDERRQRVAEVAANLIVERGLDAVTFREIAQDAGTSTAIVSHYFLDKKDLLRFTYSAAAARARARLEAARLENGDSLSAALEALLPLSSTARRDWCVWFAFWGLAIADADMGAEQRRHVRATRAELGRLMSRLVDSGSLPATFDVQDAARELLTLVMGVAAQAVFDPRDWPASRQRACITRRIALLGI